MYAVICESYSEGRLSHSQKLSPLVGVTIIFLKCFRSLTAFGQFITVHVLPWYGATQKS